MYGGDYTFESAHLNAKLHTPQEVLLSAMSSVNYKRHVCTLFHIAGLFIVFELDAPHMQYSLRIPIALAVVPMRALALTSQTFNAF